MTDHSEIIDILEVAKWAPSGDNCQPWKFQILPNNKIRIILDMQPNNIYEYNNGQPTLLAVGTLIENISIASSHYARQTKIEAIHPQKSGTMCVDLDLSKDQNIQPDPLREEIEQRSVDRNPYKIKNLPQNIIGELEECLGSDVGIKWYAGIKQKLSLISLYMRATDIRLKIPETYQIHKDMLDWKNKYSPNGIPVGATGLSKITIHLMNWAMQKQSRINFMNRYLMGTVMPRIELDIIPGLMSSGHFIFYYKNKVKGDRSPEDHIKAGRGLQRFWLTVTSYGLVMQPEMAPLIFSYYSTKKISFTSCQKSIRSAEILAEALQRVAQNPIEDIVFIGRMGYPQNPSSSKPRSVRKPLAELMINE